ncbi:hypothetical protein RCL1_008491 [Eukaryota sp. TZLM3-RCL]
MGSCISKSVPSTVIHYHSIDQPDGSPDDDFETIANNYLTSSSSNIVSLGFADNPVINSPISRRRESDSFKYHYDEDIISRRRNSYPKTSLSPSSNINFKKGELLGRGAFGSVYLGLDCDTGMLMAIKEFPRIDKSTAELVEIQQEIDLMKTLTHPNIVKYYGSQSSLDNLHVFMEYVPGGSIAQLIKKFQCFSLDVVKHYTRQILEGVAYLHSHSIIHRDLKGANILVTDDGTVKVADFGASKRLQGYHTMLNEAHSLKGTPFWMAPEIVVQSSYGRAADIWSIGCCIIEMATGRPPWAEFPAVTALFHIARSTQPPAFPQEIGQDGVNFLTQCFQRDPKLRPSAAQLLQHQFVAKSVKTSPQKTSLDRSEPVENTIKSPLSNENIRNKRRSSVQGNSLLINRMLAERETRNTVHSLRKSVRHSDHLPLSTVDEPDYDSYTTIARVDGDGESVCTEVSMLSRGASILDIRTDVNKMIRERSKMIEQSEFYKANR